MKAIPLSPRVHAALEQLDELNVARWIPDEYIRDGLTRAIDELEAAIRAQLAECVQQPVTYRARCHPR